MNATTSPRPRKGNVVVYLASPDCPRLARVVRSGRYDLTLSTFDPACPLVRVSHRAIVEIVDEPLTHDCDHCGQPCSVEHQEVYAYWGNSPEPYITVAAISDCCEAGATKRREAVQP